MVTLFRFIDLLSLTGALSPLAACLECRSLTLRQVAKVGTEVTPDLDPGGTLEEPAYVEGL